MQTFARWVTTSESEAARFAVEWVAESLAAGRPRIESNPLFLHGPSGCGKSHLVAALVHETCTVRPELTARIIASRELSGIQVADPSGKQADAWHECDLLAVEDIQLIPGRAAETLIQLVDDRIASQQQTVCTATSGPAQLNHLPARLTSRLAGGLVVRMTPLGPASRLAFLQDRIERRQLPISRDVLTWLAKHLPGSGRQLESAIARLETLVRLHDRIPDLALVAEHFHVEQDAGRLTVERITESVGRHFQVDPRLLKSKRRSRSALLPRQVAMALARRLTTLSLGQIGAYFGGRDHSTVLHACRKIESGRDVMLSGALRQLQAEFA
jgi:chromosomal replication initiator protein